MAVTINASLSAGLVQTADTTGDLSLQSGGTTRLAVTSTGVDLTGAVTGTSFAGALNGSLGATTPSTVVATSVNTPNTFGFKNRIINGAMVIDQRNAGASVTYSNSGGYVLDRWLLDNTTDGTITIQQSSVAPTGFTNSCLITVTVADASLSSSQRCRIRQPIEGFNVSDFGFGTASAATVTLSFWVRSSLTGTFGGALNNGSVDRSYPFSYTISAANTWEQKTVTVAGDTSGTWLTTNGIGLIAQFGLGIGSSFSGTAGAWAGSQIMSTTGATSVIGTGGATFYITGVQLEKGSTATSFDVRDYGNELRMCQRYYVKLDGANNGLWWSGYTTSGNQYANSFTNPVTMRASPTQAIYGTWIVSNTGQPQGGGASPHMSSIYGTASSTLPVAYYSTSTSGMTLTAEL